MTDDLVERVARAMWMADPEPYDPSDRRPFEEADWEAQRNYRAEARAALAVALEEAAKVCERRFMGDHNREDMEARRCAAAIRALIPKGLT